MAARSSPVPTDDPVLAARLEALGEDLDRPLSVLYGHRADFADVRARVLALVARARAERPEDLRALDERRLAVPDWFQRPDMLGYVCYADRFAGTLAGVGERLDHLRELGVTYLHLMPLLATRDGVDDGGYAVSDFRTVQPRLGTTEDLRALARRMRGEGISLVLDVVCNHVAREHAWARAAVAGDQRHLDYFITYPDREEPDLWERTLPEVFPDLAPGSFSWEPALERWVWTTFHDFQWDLDFANPDVLVEMLDVLCHLANLGVEVLRLDAVAFLWKRLGTSSQNQPEVHRVLQVFHAVVRLVAPATILLAEAIVSPRDLVGYLGRGDGTGKECELAYHNVFMVGLWSALAEQKATLFSHVVASMPAIPPTTAWLTYVRLHDDIGWAITDDDAAAVGLDAATHRAFLTDYYTGAFPGSPARGAVFGENPRTGDRRVSGSLASLAGLESALEGGSQADVDAAVARILLTWHLVLTFGGVPLIYAGDEVGMLNDHAFADDPAHAADNRWLHRPVMDWDAVARGHEPGTVEGRLFSGLHALVSLRAATGELHAQASTTVVHLGREEVFAFVRHSARGRLLVVANVSPAPVSVGLPDDWAHDTVWDLVADEQVRGAVRLAPYQVRWLR